MSGYKLTKRLKLRFVTLCVGEDFFNAVKKGMGDACDLMNAESSFVGTEDIDLPEQVRLVEEAIRSGVDGIALNLAHSDAFNDVIRKSTEAGIPVVAFNIDASNGNAGNLGSVCQDLLQAGKSLGQRAASDIETGSKILATTHSDGISALESRLRGIRESLGPKNLSYKVLTTGMVSGIAAEKILAEIEKDPSVRAVLCTGQADTEGAGLAVARLPAARRPYVAGFDLSPEILRLIKDGVISFTIDQQPYLQGFLPVVQLVLNVRYGIRPASVDAGATIIDRNSVDSVIELSRAGYR